MESECVTGPRTEAESVWPPQRTAWYVAILLMLANTLAFVDRQALALLVQPIKEDLQVSDTAMSLLYGLSFTLFYVVVGIPVARLADRSSRRNIIAISVSLWSVATALCGLARSFPTLFLARIAVGAGEGGLSPSAYSMLSDYFPKSRLPAAIGVYTMGVYAGGASALLIGGMIASHFPPSLAFHVPVLGMMKGWQLIFVLLGTPGILLSILLLTIREPTRKGVASDQGSMPLPDVFAHIARHWRAYFGIGIGFSLMILVGNATGAWIPAFLQRKFGMTISEIGAAYGVLVFTCGVTGTLLGGFFASFLRRRGFRLGNLLAALVGFSALIPVTIAFPLMPTPTLALTLIGVMNFFAGFNFGGGLAALQEITPNRMRALVSAGYMLLINAIGAAGGPVAIALVTDFWFADPQKLPEALSIVCAVASPLSVVALLLGIRGYSAALATEGR